MKKVLCLVLCTFMIAGNLTPVYSMSSETAAQELYELGLFRGTGTNSNGNPIFDLEKSATRQEAIVMLIRLLGKEQEALSGGYSHPFIDVDAWASPYIAYAYTNGLTSGTSSTVFDGNSIVSVAQYLTFVLRALGYNSGTDFQWDKAWELSDQIGLTNGEYDAATTTFLRGDLATISYNALTTENKSGDLLFDDLNAPNTLQNTSNYNSAACTNHNYYNNGYCSNCKEEYPITVTSMVPTIYYARKNDVPIRDRPYMEDTVLSRIKKGEAVTIVGSGINAVNNLWYILADGRWIYSNNLTLSDPYGNNSIVPDLIQSEDGNYYIKTADELEKIGGAWSTGKTFILNNDIDLLSYKNWKCIEDFRGTLDGQGYKIYNMNISNTNNAGLFGIIRVGQVTIKNLGVYTGTTGVSVSITTGILPNTDDISDIASAGILIGRCNGGTVNIENCYVAGSVSVESNARWVLSKAVAGGFIGYIDSNEAIIKIENSYAKGNVESKAKTSYNLIINGLVQAGSQAESYSAGMIGYIKSIRELSIKSSYTVNNIKAAATIMASGDMYEYTSGLANINSSIFNNLKGEILNCYYVNQQYSFDNLDNILETLEWVNRGIYILSKGRIGIVDINSLKRAELILGQSLLHEDMKKPNKFAGFDFNGIWKADESINEGYPYLQIFKNNSVNLQVVAICNHSYSSGGYCTKCVEEFPIQLTSMSVVMYAKNNSEPVRNRPYISGTIIRRLNKGTAVNVVGSGRNYVGNLWYLLDDGNWIHEDNVSETAPAVCITHSYNSSGYCTKCSEEYQINMTSMSVVMYAKNNSEPVRNRPYISGTIIRRLNKGTAVNVVGSGRNYVGNLWYLLDDGNWIHEDNISATDPTVCISHSYNSSGYCTKCSEEFPIQLTSMSVVMYAKNNSEPVRNRPYISGTIIRRLNKGTAVNVVGSGRNYVGSLWYKLDDGNWIHEDNISATDPTVCISHSYNSSGYCTKCSEEFPIQLTSMSVVMYAKNNSEPVRNRPYISGTIIRRLNKGTVVNVVGSGRNYVGSLWYLLDDGNWIHEDNISATDPTVCISHSYNSSGYCTKCSEEFPIQLTSMSVVMYAKSGGLLSGNVPVRSRPYEGNNIVRRLSKGTAVNIVGQGKNSVGNLWYLLDDGNWIYSGNVSQN